MLLLSPGPGICDQDVLDVLAQPCIHHRSDLFKQTYRSIVSNMKVLLHAPHSEIILMSGSGSTGMEGAVKNLIASHDHVLCIRCGYFSERFYQMASYQNCTMYSLYYNMSETYIKEDVEWMLKHYEIDAVLVTHSESETGSLQDLKILGELCHTYHALCIVDSISGVIMNEVHMDEEYIDCLIMSSQKGFMMPPGLSISALSQNAIKKMKQIHVKSYILDYKMMLAKYENDARIQTTPCIPLYLALSCSLGKLMKYSTKQLASYYHKLHDEVKQELMKLGFQILALGHESNSLIVCSTPKHLRASCIQEKLEKQGVRIELGLRDRDDRILRIGIMNAVKKQDLDIFLMHLRNILYET